MKNFTKYDLDSSPEKSKALLENSLKTYGRIPGLHAIMAEAPGLLEGYQVLHKLFQETSFNAEEITVVWQTINVEHECTYCVPAHTGIANMMNVDPALTEALRTHGSMPTAKLQTLHDTTLAVVRKRGNLSEEEMETFFAAGYEQRQLLEIVLGVAQKVMSNYVNHIAHTPVDEAFQTFTWQPPA
ncbi:MAG: carboxymuconolactone decarboxylase [Desulfuromonas sp.]|nr:MAG: carboxymuconolactone decarboxylase [Desulfuromonas sp.]